MAMNFDTRYSDVSTGDELRLSDYLAAVLGNWKLVTLVMLVAVALGTAYAFIAPPTYKADALIQVEESNNNNNNANANAVQTVSQMFDAKSTTAAQIELLRSRLVVDDTVQRLHLDITAAPRYFPFVGGSGEQRALHLHVPMPAGYMSRFAWGNEAIQVPLFDTPKEQYGKTFTLVAGEHGTYVLNDPDGIAILNGKVGAEVTGRELARARAAEGGQARRRTRRAVRIAARLDARHHRRPAKAPDRGRDRAAVGHHQREPGRRRQHGRPRPS